MIVKWSTIHFLVLAFVCTWLDLIVGMAGVSLLSLISFLAFVYFAHQDVHHWSWRNWLGSLNCHTLEANRLIRKYFSS
jgi:hypothetical protein